MVLNDCARLCPMCCWLQAAAEHGIKVARVPTYSPQSVAEHAVALMFALNRWAWNPGGRRIYVP